MSNCNCPSVFRPGKIGNIEIRNRAVMPSMGLSATPGGYVNEVLLRHYVEHAKGGVGLIMTEVTCIDAPLGLNTDNMLRADNDSYIPGLKKLVDSVHAEGAKIVLQISHTGRGAKREIIGAQPVGPSPVALEMMAVIGIERETPRELTIEEIKAIEDKYAEGALRAKKAGFDGVEIHCTGYYLCLQFLNPKSNIRTDEYGGSLENRFRFIGNIIDKIKVLCGEDFPILVKPTLFEDGAISFEDGAAIVNMFIQKGVAAIECMGGSNKRMPDETDHPYTVPSPNNVTPLAQAFKGMCMGIYGESLKTQFIGGGDIRTSADAEACMAAGCDFVYIGKSHIVEPHLINLWKEGKDELAHPCIGCFLCATIQLSHGYRAYCAGNGAMKNDYIYDMPIAEKKKKVIVVGAGPAGIEAAKQISRKGHDVTIIERSAGPGGQIHYAEKPLNKTTFKALIPYYEATIKGYGINAMFNTEATVDLIRELDPDVVVCATGVKNRKLPIPGIDMSHVVEGKDYLIGKQEVSGHAVVVVGGGDVGCEVAEKLASEGHKVTLLEMTNVLAPGYQFYNRCFLMQNLNRFGVDQKMGIKCKRIFEGRVEAQDNLGFLFDIPCDNVVLCTGDPSDNTLFNQLKGLVPELYIIGDAGKPADLSQAHADAYAVALKV